MEMLLINRYYYYYFYYYYYHYYYTFKNSGLSLSLSLPTIIFMCEHSSFKRVITPSNLRRRFLGCSGVLARKDPGTAFPFNSLLGRFQINIKALFRIIFCFSKI